MAKTEINGKEYELRMDLYAMELIEDAFGDTYSNAMEALRKRSFKTARKLFVILANSAKSFRGEVEDVSEEEFKHLDMTDVVKMTEAIMQAQEESFRKETIDGAADDSHHDDTLEEIEAEEAKNGATGNS